MKVLAGKKCGWWQLTFTSFQGGDARDLRAGNEAVALKGLAELNLLSSNMKSVFDGYGLLKSDHWSKRKGLRGKIQFCYA